MVKRLEPLLKRAEDEGARLAGVPAEALAEFPPAWIERVRAGPRSTHRRGDRRHRARWQHARTAAAERALVWLRTNAYASSTPPRARAGRGGRRISAGVGERARTGELYLP